MQLRERNKRDKLQRITAAAFALFAEKGFDDTTLREIAERADVGFGTIFSYARDKRDLLFLLFSEQMATISEPPFNRVDESKPLVDQLISFFKPNYELFVQAPNLSRSFLREMTFYEEDPTYRSGLPDRATYEERLTQLIDAAQRSGRIKTPASPQLMASTIYSTYAGAIRQWLRNANPTPAAGISELRKMLSLIIAGVGAH